MPVIMPMRMAPLPGTPESKAFKVPVMVNKASPAASNSRTVRRRRSSWACSQKTAAAATAAVAP